MSQSLKGLSQEIDESVHYQITRFLILWESHIIEDGLTLAPFPPPEGPGGGIRRIFEKVDSKMDFQDFMEVFLRDHNSANWSREEKNPTDLTVSRSIVHLWILLTLAQLLPLPESTSLALPTPPISAGEPREMTATGTFGVPLAQQMERDNVEIPTIILKCTQVIEEFGKFIRFDAKRMAN